MPISTTRFITDIGLPESVLQSKRYAPYAKSLFESVTGEGFRGVWIIQGGLKASTLPHVDIPGGDTTPTPNPRNSDIIIYYLHGGGYFSSSPSTYLTFLLKLAETILKEGKSVSIFALDYDLSPEFKFPTQLGQARKGYEWLLRDIENGGAGVSKGKVLIVGDSAGGHLSLSLLVDLWDPFEGVDSTKGHAKEDPFSSSNNNKPGLGLILISPWLSLFHAPDSFTRNALTDVLSQSFLHNTARLFIPSGYREFIPNNGASWLEFLDSKVGIDWDSVLPQWVWVVAGRHEIMYDDIVKWYKDREADCPATSPHGVGGTSKKRIGGELDKAGPHIYPVVKTLDQSYRKKFCDTRMEDGDGVKGEFDAIERIGEAILLRWESCQSSSR